MAAARIIANDRFQEEYDTVEKLRLCATRNSRLAVGSPAQRAEWRRLNSDGALYTKYTGMGFPLKIGAKKPPRWQDMSWWMKFHIGMICLEESALGFVAFRYHPHGALLEEKGERVGEIIHDRIRRLMRSRFGIQPLLISVCETADDKGNPTRLHFHAAIALPSLELPRLKNGKLTSKYRKMVEAHGEKVSLQRYAKECIRLVVKDASGNKPSAISIFDGVSQSQNIWFGSPKRGSNRWYIDYIFKNVERPCGMRPERMVYISRNLSREARRFWDLVRNGKEKIELA